MPDWFFQGGIVMWPLLACSVAAVAIVLERIWALRRRRIISAPLVAELQQSRPNPPDTAGLRNLAAADPTVLGELARVSFHHAWLPKAENVEAIQASARQILSRLERGLTTLALV